LRLCGLPAGRHQVELVWRRNRQTRREVEIAVFEHINGFSNPRRKHATLGWKSPAAFERWAAQREYLTGTKPVPDQPATCEAGAGQPTSARLNPRRMKLVDLQDFCHPDYMDALNRLLKKVFWSRSAGNSSCMGLFHAVKEELPTDHRRFFRFRVP